MKLVAAAAAGDTLWSALTRPCNSERARSFSIHCARGPEKITAQTDCQKILPPKWNPSDRACHPCAGAMLIFSVSFLKVDSVEGVRNDDPIEESVHWRKTNQF